MPFGKKGSLQGDEEKEKKFIQIGQAVPELSNFQILMTLKVNFKVTVDEIWLVRSIRSTHFPNTCPYKPCPYLAPFGL